MKSELTQEIERALRAYDPVDFDGIVINKKRLRHISFEFPVENGTTRGGMIDAMIIAEYFRVINSYKKCALFSLARMVPPDLCSCFPAGSPAPERCPSINKCICQQTQTMREEDILFIALEIKISRSDFLSKNGHNFCGNLNYYVMPNELWTKCKKDIPDGIGVISASQGEYGYSLRRVKSSQFKPLSDEQQKWFLLTALKK